MSGRPIPYLSTQAAEDLWKQVPQNESRYLSGEFGDVLAAPGATMFLPVSAELDRLADLDAAENDLHNAKVVWSALYKLTPSLGRENRIWTHLCHSEALHYARSRWLSKKSSTPTPDLIKTHFFAKTQTMCRDDNALGRLWWSAYVAYKAAPTEQDEALALILKTADIRSNFVERTWMSTRPSVASALVRAMKGEPWITQVEQHFRETMKALNVEGAGLAFEALSAKQVDLVVQAAVGRARSVVGT